MEKRPKLVILQAKKPVNLQLFFYSVLLLLYLGGGGGGSMPLTHTKSLALKGLDIMILSALPNVK